MAYQVLARKWRPQDFSQVVGQQPIVTALRNALSENKIAQAYLFSGIRGVGKTSVARVLAKALNCENGPAPDPCNRCPTCRQITEGSDLDVIEVDAATYSKVEQVRELTESLKYGPARDRYKVVVIDEIHRLSRQAFDALLKIVEEPPPHLVFVFATTEIDAVPATVLSRCQEFHFRRVPSQRLVDHLAAVAEAEDIEASETALRLIARAGEGSVRDAVALLDQLATYGSGSIPDEDALRILGGIDTALQARLLESILAGNGAEVVALVNEIEQVGWDPRRVFGEFLAYCRDALHLALGARPEDVDLPREEAANLARLATGAGYESLLLLLHQLLGSEPTVRRSDAGTLALEIAWLRAAELPRLVHIEEILAAKAPPSARPSAAPAKPRRQPSADPPEESPAPVPAAPPRAKAAAVSRPEPAESGEESPAPARAEAATVSRPEPAESGEESPAEVENSAREKTDGFLELVSRRRQALAAHLAAAQGLGFEDGELRIHASPDDDWLANALARANNRRVLEECVAATWGETARWRLVEASAHRDEEDSESARESAAGQSLLDHPAVQTALDIFGGTATPVESDDN